jgi:hypothetical protein
VPVFTKRIPLSSGAEKCPRRRTFIGLLNTLQAQQRVLEKEAAKKAFPSLQGKKGTEDEDLCKEHTRPTPR